MKISEIILILVSVLPAIIIGFYSYKIDKRKEPIPLLALLFCMGVSSALLVLGVSYVIEIPLTFLAKSTETMNFLELFLKVFVEIAFIEEICKWLIIYFVGYKNKEFDESYDIILYSVFVALGFATFENLIYVIDANSVNLAFQRGLLAIPGHVSYAIFMSYYLSVAKIHRLKRDNLEFMSLVKSILIPVVFHGIYDFCVFTNNILFTILFYIFVIILFVLAFLKLRELSKNNADMKQIKRVI
ncbi:MAG: PrsW family intramembrane metalloprotease [Bacilli bacterium]|nr:PrsW family intramembrane metalloprotease [Bacilli bacterium]